jgi:hypothetical protein
MGKLLGTDFSLSQIKFITTSSPFTNLFHCFAVGILELFALYLPHNSEIWKLNLQNYSNTSKNATHTTAVN